MAKTIFAKDPVTYIPALAEALKGMGEFEAPEWALYVKTGPSRERPPAADDFWFTRSASILRQLYIQGVVGVGRLRTRYGTRKDRGTKPDKFYKASGKIIRMILQQAESAGLVEQVSRLQHGRRLTQKGRDFLDAIVSEEKKGLDFAAITTTKVAVQDNQEDPQEVSDLEEISEETNEESKQEESNAEGESA